MTTSETREGSTGSGALWMLILAVLLSWLPVLGPLVAGFVGGRMIGEQRRALSVALLPAVALALVIWLILAIFDLPVLGAVAGFGALVVVAVQLLPLLAGAWFGGASGPGGATT
ncbi:MAG TPA: hypothetical protein VM307_04960 [Egibacteraceae bacterium]|nr:hypothetical protein [Egibacteraceae bacterium]